MQRGDLGLSRRGLLSGVGVGLALSALPVSVRAAAVDDLPALRALARRYVQRQKVAGMLCAIGLGDGPLRTVGAGHLAFQSKQPVDRDTLWRIYSMTKPVTGMAAMLLIEDGKLTLDQPLYDILPKFRDMTVLRRPEGPLNQVEPAKRPITIRNLLTHTAGLGYSIVNKGPIAKAYVERGINPGRVTRLTMLPMFRGQPASSFKSFADNLADLPLVYQPGTAWSYSIGLDLLGYVIELVSGLPFEKFLQQRLFGPLDMTSTFFTVPRARAGELATNYGVLNDMVIPIDPGRGSIYLDRPNFPFGGAGLVSSARDYDRFLHMLMNYGHLDGTRVMAEKTAGRAMSDLLPEGVDKSMMIVRGGFGAGGLVGFGGKGGSASGFGWAGAAGTVGFADPVRRIRGGGYTQYMPYSAYPFTEELIAAIASDVAGLRPDLAA